MIHGGWEFKTPDTLQEAIDRKAILGNELADISRQLGSRNRRDGDDSRLSSHEYWQWRDRAKSALRIKMLEVQFLKKWMTDHHQKNIEKRKLTGDVASLADDAKRCLYQLIDTVRELQAKNAELMEENQQLRDAVDQFRMVEEEA